MLYVRLMGGLGNQMFQYAAAHVAAKRKRTDLKLDLTDFELSGDGNEPVLPTRRRPDILEFALDAELAEAGEVAGFRKPKTWLQSKASAAFHKLVVNHHIDYSAGLLAPGRFGYMNGYFQDERYFAPFAAEIVRQFRLRDDSAITSIHRRILALPNPVSIHVRRGDYVIEPTRAVLDICDAAYYQRAMTMMREATNAFTPVVFSDDLGWVKHNLDFGENAVFPGDSGDLTAPEELVLMSRCAHHIIANSTFSWWGAYLNTRPGRIVIAPQHWTRDPRRYRNIVPKSWLRT